MQSSSSKKACRFEENYVHVFTFTFRLKTHFPISFQLNNSERVMRPTYIDLVRVKRNEYLKIRIKFRHDVHTVLFFELDELCFAVLCL